MQNTLWEAGLSMRTYENVCREAVHWSDCIQTVCQCPVEIARPQRQSRTLVALLVGLLSYQSLFRSLARTTCCTYWLTKWRSDGVVILGCTQYIISLCADNLGCPHLHSSRGIAVAATAASRRRRKCQQLPGGYADLILQKPGMKEG